MALRWAAIDIYYSQLEPYWILPLEMASQGLRNLFFQKSCLCFDVRSGRNQFGGDVAVYVKRLTTHSQMKIQNPGTFEN